MPTCSEIEPLITAVVDDEATSTERAAVGAHLQQCGPCRRRAADETSARRILRARADTFHVEAPAMLRARCRPARPSPWRAIIRPIPVWAAAVVLVVVLAGVFYGVGRGSTALAAGLALDHVKCFALFEKASGPGDATVIAERMKESYGWSFTIPATSVALGLRLVGGRRCFSTDGRVAHILYPSRRTAAVAVHRAGDHDRDTATGGDGPPGRDLVARRQHVRRSRP